MTFVPSAAFGLFQLPPRLCERVRKRQTERRCEATHGRPTPTAIPREAQAEAASMPPCEHRTPRTVTWLLTEEKLQSALLFAVSLVEINLTTNFTFSSLSLWWHFLKKEAVVQTAPPCVPFLLQTGHRSSLWTVETFIETLYFTGPSDFLQRKGPLPWSFPETTEYFGANQRG